MAATLHVFTFKEGLLARLAHDLRLHVERFSVDSDGATVRATFHPSSVRVDGVAHGERVDATALSEKDRRSIEATVANELLPGVVTLEGEVRDGAVRARLTMRGRARELDLPVRVVGNELHVEAELVPSRWGVAPYKAVGGAIRLQDRWRVRLVLPGTGMAGEWKGPAGG